jgi:hypothetical protein
VPLHVGALHMLMRHPHLFHRAAVCDVPVLGDFVGEMKPWGIAEWDNGKKVDKPPWWSFNVGLYKLNPVDP